MVAECRLTLRPERDLPRLAQANVCNAIVVAEGYVKVAVSIKGAAIETEIFLESLEEKSALIEGGFCFARHHENRDTARAQRRLRSEDRQLIAILILGQSHAREAGKLKSRYSILRYLP